MSDDKTQPEQAPQPLADTDPAAEATQPSDEAVTQAYLNDMPLDEAFLDEGEAGSESTEISSDEATADIDRDAPGDNNRPLTEKLKAFADQLMDNPAPLLRKDSVIIPREPALDLIEELLAYAESDGLPAEDNLIDALAADGHYEDPAYRPLHRVKSRAQVIIANATVQADNIVNDARVLSKQLLQDTEDQIKARYDEVDTDIKNKLDGAQILSEKRLTEARSALTQSRQQAVDIINRYMDKAEDDYQGYWIRAEKTLQAALDKSDVTLGKVADVFERELEVIAEDLQTIDGILEELKMNRPR